MLDPWLASARRTAALVASVPLFLAIAPAHAQPEPSGARRHEGFFMRFVVGPGVAVATTSVDGEDLSASGVGATIHAALGYNILPKLVLYGEVFDALTISPTVEAGDEGNELDDAALGMAGIGAGLAYFLPRNFHLSAAFSLASLQVDYRDEGGVRSNDTDPGFGATVRFGSEFWVADSWALGACVQLFAGSVPAAASDDSWTVGVLGAGLSATYD